jgi:excisionase family DNA binding protein
MTHDNDEEMSVAEACKLLRIGRWKFYQLVKNDELPTHKSVGNRRMAWKSDVLAVRERAASAPAPPKRPGAKA